MPDVGADGEDADVVGVVEVVAEVEFGEPEGDVAAGVIGWEAWCGSVDWLALDDVLLISWREMYKYISFAPTLKGAWATAFAAAVTTSVAAIVEPPPRKDQGTDLSGRLGRRLTLPGWTLGMAA